MNKEQQELVGDAYKNHILNLSSVEIHDVLQHDNLITQEEFINKIKTDDEFAKKWGLTIEVRELSQEERFKIAYKNLELRKKLESESAMLHYPSGHSKVMDDANIPTRAISLTYNDKTIESYE
jgi:hypothetical protein